VLWALSFVTKKHNFERYVHVIIGQLFPELTEEERLDCWFQQDSATAHTARMSSKLCPLSSGTELSAVVFGQHVHPILIFVNFSSLLV
jgi:hypothetical protein